MYSEIGCGSLSRARDDSLMRKMQRNSSYEISPRRLVPWPSRLRHAHSRPNEIGWFLSPLRSQRQGDLNESTPKHCSHVGRYRSREMIYTESYFCGRHD